jgi:hypothetical protein
MKKYALQLAIVILILAGWIPVKADIIFSESDTMDIGESTGYPGDTVNVIVNMANPSFAIEGISHKIVYEEMFLEIDMVHCLDRGCNLEYFTVDYSVPGVISIIAMTWVSNLIPSGSGPVLDLHFVIDSTAPPGEITIVEFQNENLGDNCWADSAGVNLIIPVLENGSITINPQTFIGENSRLPGKFELTQNYPNPFNASTTIEYGLPEAAHVRIQIYDLLGRKIETLVEEHKRAGQHQVGWDASGRSSGVYFYRIEAGDNIETKKMILLK